MNNIFSIYSINQNLNSNIELKTNNNVSQYALKTIQSSNEIRIGKSYETFEKELLRISNYEGDDRNVIDEIFIIENELYKEAFSNKHKKNLTDSQIIYLAHVVINNPEISSTQFLEYIKKIFYKSSATLSFRLLTALRCYIHYNNNQIKFNIKATKASSFEEAYIIIDKSIAYILIDIVKCFSKKENSEKFKSILTHYNYV